MELGGAKDKNNKDKSGSKEIKNIRTCEHKNTLGIEIKSIINITTSFQNMPSKRGL